jgi:hypothetical protein
VICSTNAIESSNALLPPRSRQARDFASEQDTVKLGRLTFHRLEISSNPGIHDYDLARELLDTAYQEGLTDYLDEDLFSDRLREITESRVAEVQRFMADLRGGSLRTRTDRQSPVRRRWLPRRTV